MTARHIEPHPIAALLTPEMRARVRAARFVRNDDPDRDRLARVVAEVNGVLCCPVGVAIGDPDMPFPIADRFSEAIGDWDYQHCSAAESFIDLVDDDGITDPADVYVLLGCEPEESTP